MTDLTDAVAAAAAASIAAACAVPVFTIVPENTEPPYTVVGDDEVDPTIGGKADTVERHELRIVTIFAGGSKRAMLAEVHAVNVALRTTPFTAPGATLSQPVRLSASDRIDPASGAIVGEQTFLIFAQGATT